MTLANRRKYKNYMLYTIIGLLIVFLFARFKNRSTPPPPPPPVPVPQPLTIWQMVENVAFGLALLIAIALLVMVAPLIPFIASWIIYGIAGIIAIYALYMTVLRHGSNDGMLPDHPMHNHEMYNTDGGGSILTVLPYVKDYRTPMDS